MRSTFSFKLLETSCWAGGGSAATIQIRSANLPRARQDRGEGGKQREREMRRKGIGKEKERKGREEEGKERREGKEREGKEERKGGGEKRKGEKRTYLCLSVCKCVYVSDTYSHMCQCVYMWVYV